MLNNIVGKGFKKSGKKFPAISTFPEMKKIVAVFSILSPMFINLICNGNDQAEKISTNSLRFSMVIPPARTLPRRKAPDVVL